jgi:hypothetical protein
MIALPDGGWSGVANDLADRRAGVVLAPVPCALNNVPIRANVRAGIRMRYVFIRVLGAGYTSRVQAARGGHQPTQSGRLCLAVLPFDTD